MNRLGNFLRLQWHLATGAEASDPAFLRKRLLDGMLLTVAVLGLPALVIGSLAALGLDERWRAWLYVASYGLILLTTLVRNRIPFKARAMALLMVLLVLGSAEFISSGVEGVALLFLLTFSVLGSLLYGMIGGLTCLGLSIAAALAVLWATEMGFIGSLLGQTAALESASLVSALALYAPITLVLIVGLALFQRSLETSMADQHGVVRRLQGEQEMLELDAFAKTQEVERSALLLQAATDIAKHASRSNDLREVMTRTVERIRSGFGYYHASIFLLDETENWAEIAASTGEAGQTMMQRRHRLGVGSPSFIGWVTSHREARVSANVAEDPFHLKNPLLPETRSEMAIPLIAGDRLVGVLDVQSKNLGAFQAEDVQALEAIGSEIAIALENFQLRQERAEQLEELHRQRSAGVRRAWEELTRKGGRTSFHLGGSRESGEEDFITTKDALRTGRIAVDNSGREVAVPIHLRGEVIATIAARRRQDEERWSEEDIALLTAVAGQAALALETARQYAEEQRRVAELEVVNRISQAASQMLRPESLFRIVHSQISQVLGDTDMIVALVEPERDRLTFPYAVDRGQLVAMPQRPLETGMLGHVVHSRQPLLLFEDTLQQAGMLGHVVHSRQPLLLIEDTLQQAGMLGISEPGSIPRSWLGVPMLSGEQVVGVLCLKDDDAEHRYSEDDLALMSTIAGQVATALENFRLLDQVQRTARRERLIHEISSKVRRSADIQGILETAAREVGRALNATRASVRLGETDKPGDAPGEKPDEQLAGEEMPQSAGQERPT